MVFLITSSTLCISYVVAVLTNEQTLQTSIFLLLYSLHPTEGRANVGPRAVPRLARLPCGRGRRALRCVVRRRLDEQ